MTSDDVVWIGLASVEQRPGVAVLKRPFAYVNVLAVAGGPEEFSKRASEGLDELGLDLVSLREVEPLWERLLHHGVDEKLLQLADEVKSAGRPLFGPFHAWERDDGG